MAIHKVYNDSNKKNGNNIIKQHPDSVFPRLGKEATLVSRNDKKNLHRNGGRTTHFRQAKRNQIREMTFESKINREAIMYVNDIAMKMIVLKNNVIRKR